jgi:hypothetical protein
MFPLANHIITSANQGGVANLSYIFNFHFFPFSTLKIKRHISMFPLANRLIITSANQLFHFQIFKFSNFL